MINFEEFQKIDLRVAKVIEAERVEDSDKLLKLQIDLGPSTGSGQGKRQIVAGIQQFYAPEGGDAILVCNFDKKGIKNYIGGNTLMEIGFAHVNDKKVFLLNPIPKNLPYSDEIEAMVDVVINGDLTKLYNYGKI